MRGGSEQDELKAAQSFEIPGRDLREDAAFFLPAGGSTNRNGRAYDDWRLAEEDR